MQHRLDDLEALMGGYVEKLDMVNDKVEKVLEHLEVWGHSAHQQPGSTSMGQSTEEICQIPPYVPSMRTKLAAGPTHMAPQVTQFDGAGQCQTS